MSVYYVCFLICLVASLFLTLSVKRSFDERISMLEKTIEKMSNETTALALSEAKANEKILILNTKVKDLDSKLDITTHVTHNLSRDFVRLEDYVDNRRELDKQQERMLSGINNIMNYDEGVAREAVRNIDEEDEGNEV